MREHARAIFDAALAAVDPQRCVRDALRLDNTRLFVRGHDRAIDLAEFDNVLVLGAGKAAVPMAAAVHSVLGERISAGHVVTKYGHSTDAALLGGRIGVTEAGHPVPDEAGVAGTTTILDLARRHAGERTLTVVCISGGGSALTPAPAPGLTLADLAGASRALLACGARIGEVNAVRKHLSQFAGGQLLRATAPSRVLSLILSDVVGDPLDTIASGPTVEDRSSFAECERVLLAYPSLRRELPPAVLRHLDGALPEHETPTLADSAELFARCTNVVVGSNRLAVSAAAHKAREFGYGTLVLSTSVEGEAREVAKVLAATAQEVLASHQPLAAPACILAGGETTVTLRGTGTGGRNQELALAAAFVLDRSSASAAAASGRAGGRQIVLLSAGTDGTDGPTDAAGAVVDCDTLAAPSVRAHAESALRENNSYAFHAGTGGLVVTGPTGTNVMDVCCMLVREDADDVC